MIRKHPSPIQTITASQLLKSAALVLRSADSLSLLYWEPQYLSYFIHNHFIEFYQAPEYSVQERLNVENLMARCCWYHKDTTKEVAEFFEQLPQIDLATFTQPQILERLKVLNLLTLVDWFPSHLIQTMPLNPQLDKLTQVYLINLIKFKGQESVTIDESEYIQEITHLRDFLLQSQNQRERFLAEYQQKSQSFTVTDIQVDTKSKLYKQVTSHNLLTLVTSEQQLPEELRTYPKIEIWVDKSIEFNSLIGNYVCSEKYGEFKWVNGPLIYALEKGLWLVMNNFQQATNELIVALKNIVNNGCLHCQSLGTVYAAPGFRIIGISNQAVDNIPTVTVEEKDPATLLPSNLIERSREYLLQVLMQNKKLGYLKLKRLWRRIEYIRREFVKTEYQYEVENIWEGSITAEFKELVREEVDQINNIFYPKTVDYVKRGNDVKIGKVTFRAGKETLNTEKQIIPTQYSLRIMEKISMGVAMDQSILLVSETGCGKTTLIQHLAKLRGKKLYVINMNIGSEASDLIGGFKPLDFKFVYEKIVRKFRDYFQLIKTDKSLKFQNKFLEQYGKDDNYLNVLKLILKNIEPMKKRYEEHLLEEERKQQLEEDSQDASLLNWDRLQERVKRFIDNFDIMKNQLVFSFVEGNLLKALRNGDWILIDEINLAGNEVLQKLVPLVTGNSLLMYEKGDMKMVARHPDFRMFGCMNPGNDHGKKQLPKNLQDKFTILELPEPEKEDIKFFIESKCPAVRIVSSDKSKEKLQDLYFKLKAKKTISLRNLSRALNYINSNISVYGERAKFDGLVLGFGEKDLFQSYYEKSKLLKKQGYVEKFEFLIEEGPHKIEDTTFKITSRFQQHVKDLLRAVAGTDLPVMLQGPTSAGKTSMVRYLAAVSGHKCIRINNHEHTDVEEYLGTYYPSKTGQLVFREGPLVEAVRNGYWLILDELNLARSEILECLNRLLDDNKQLFLPEIQETLKPHPHFRIFATQNPASYSGRKILSKAFRNRFVQLEMGEISTEQTIEILQQRVPFVEHSQEIRKYLASVLNSLSQYRLREKIFIKDAVITIRDLLKWTGRTIDTSNLKENFALEGFTVIGERLRTLEEKQYVKSVLCNSIGSNKKIKSPEKKEFDEKSHYKQLMEQLEFNSIESIRLNSSFTRMTALTLKALQGREPVLLIGETGCGKTTLAELLAHKFGIPFFSINCHKHIQASDFLGCLRPNPLARQPGQSPFVFVNGVLLNALTQGGLLLIDQINTAEDSVLERMNEVLEGGLTIGIERGEGWEVIEAHPKFRIIATMNPSGDFGKKQLSPALRNRFTEIWVQPVTHPASLQQYQQVPAEQNDVFQMILKQMRRKGILDEAIAWNLFNLVCNFNINLCQKYSIQKRTLTMRDIVWIINFIYKSQHINPDINQRFLQALHILLIEGIEFLPLTSTSKAQLRQQLQETISLPDYNPFTTLLQLDFPILISSDLPLHLIPINFEQRIFFNIYTQLSDILGQYRPEGNIFKWYDGPLLSAVKEGRTVALIDLNLAQQEVIEGINSLFDYRGNIFVVDLDTTFQKHQLFKPVVVLRTKIQGDRKMLPNSFLNRFVKLHLGEFTVSSQVKYLSQRYPDVPVELLEKIQTFLTESARSAKPVQLKQLQLFCELYLQTRCLKRSLKISFLSQSLHHLPSLNSIFQFQSLTYSHTRQEQHLISHLPLLHKNFFIRTLSEIELLLEMLIIFSSTSRSIIIKGKQTTSKTMISKAFSWLLNLNFTHILLANNTDSAQLLGSYQQTQLNGEPVFQYISSRLIQSFTPSNLVYIQVFSDKMVERIEKGISEIYDRKQRVIIGCQGANIESVAVELGADRQTFQKRGVQREPINKVMEIMGRSNGSLNLPSNITNIAEATKYLNQNSMIQIIKGLIKGVSSQTVKATLKNKNPTNDNTLIQKIVSVLSYIQNAVHSELNPSFDLLTYQQQIKTKTLDQLTTAIIKPKYNSITYNTEEFQQNYNKLRISTTMPKTFQEYKLQCIVKFLFQLDRMSSDQLIRLFSYEEQVSLKEIKRVFQRLYIVNPNNFRVTAIQMLRVIMTQKPLLDKFFKEMMAMSEGSYHDHLIYLQETMDNEVIKEIPILNSPKSINHYITDLIQDESETPQYPILSILNVINYDSLILPQYSSLMPSHESQLFESISELKNDSGLEVVGATIANTSMKNTKLFDIFNDSFYKINKTRHLEIPHTVTEIASRLNLQGNDLKTLGETLLRMFSPRETVEENICYFEKNYQNYQILREYSHFSQVFFSVEKYLSTIRCGQFQPSFLSHLSNNLTETEKQLVSLSNYIVYRGPDNINQLKYFFSNLMNQYSLLSEEKFSKEGIHKFVKQTYIFYDRFKDILIPLITGVLLLASEGSKPSNVLLQQCVKPSMFELIDSFTIHEVPDKMEEDNAKRHILLQRKLHEMVIDEYTKEGVQFHKDQEEEDFKENFRPQLMKKGEEPLDRIFGYFREDRMDYYHMALSHMNQVQRIEELAVWMTLIMKPRSKEELNIYAETSIDHSRSIIDELFCILKHLKQLLTTFNTDQTRALCLLVNAILNLKVFKTEIYQLLQGCQHIVNKIIELNNTLPKSLHISTESICGKIIELRKIEMRNWTKMIQSKEQRVEKNDLVEFIQLWRQVHNGDPTQDELFTLSDRFVRESTIGTYLLRLESLECLGESLRNWTSLMRVHEFYSYFLNDHQESIKELKENIQKDIKEYKQLAGWKSTNYLILKSTSEKFQRSIHKILKKYQDSLKTPFLTIIQKQREQIFAGSLEEYHQRFKCDVVENSSNVYEELIESIFQSIEEMRSQAHSNKSRMTTVDQYSKEIQEMIDNLMAPVSNLYTENNFVPDFSGFPPEFSLKLKKYYYGIWDKFNQRNEVQGKWEVDKMDKLWRIIEGGWKYINHWIYTKGYVIKQIDQRVDQFTNVKKLLKPYGWTLENPKQLKGHPLFEQQVSEFNSIIKQRGQKQPNMVVEDQEVVEMCGFMKLLYITSRIILNLQKSGFCVKDKEEQQGEGEGELMKDGMGLGEADADKEAENIADEIEFEEQLQGLKGEKEANQDNIDDKDKEKDFEMENDFNGQAEDLEPKEDQEEQPDEDKMDEGFGEVGKQDQNQLDQGQDSEKQDNGENKKEEDLQFKTDKKAGDEDEIKAKDEPKDKKDQRNLGEDEFKGDDGEGEEDSNMEPGEKLDEMEVEEENDDLEKDSGVEERDDERMEVESQDDREERSLQEKDPDEDDKEGENSQMDEVFEHKNEDKEMMEEEMPEEEKGEEPEKEEKPQIKSKPKPKKTPAYGVEGEEKNPLLNGEEEQKNQEQENNNEGENAKGKDDNEQKQKSNNQFSRELIEEIMQAAQQTGNQEFKKNLNVTENSLDEKEGVDEKQEEKDEKEKEEGEQYGLSKDSNVRTNLTSKQKPSKVQQTVDDEEKEQELDEEKGMEEKKEQVPTEKKEKVEDQKKPMDSKRNQNQNQNKDTEEPSKPKKEKKEHQRRDNNFIPMEVEEIVPRDSNPDEIVPIERMNEYLLSNKLPGPEADVIYLGPDDQLINQSEKHSYQLYQELKAVLEPQQIASYQGDYKTGKKLNMRKIIQFIASQYRKDRIWLRRAEPTDRNYQIMIGIDDTKSMALNEVGKQALEGSFALAFALAKLNIKIGISRMNATTTILHPFEQMFTQSVGKQIVSQFSFSYESPKSRKIVMSNFMRDSLQEFKKQKQRSSNDQTEQLCFIVSDGHFDKADVLTYLREAAERGVTYIYIIVDNPNNSIMNIKTAIMRKGEMRYDTSTYMNDFPFEYYLIVKDVKDLSGILGEVLRQYFEQR